MNWGENSARKAEPYMRLVAMLRLIRRELANNPKKDEVVSMLKRVYENWSADKEIQFLEGLEEDFQSTIADYLHIQI